MTTWQGTRACRGCDGSGYDYKHPDLSTFDSFEDCMVCGGTGRVEAKPPVSDALADAETLRGLPVICMAGAVIYGQRAASASVPAVAYRNAREAASYAFRAVPGLRE